jgi:hypothetical protein
MGQPDCQVLEKADVKMIQAVQPRNALMATARSSLVGQAR